MNTIQRNVRFRWFFFVFAFAALVGTGGADLGHAQPAARPGMSFVAFDGRLSSATTGVGSQPSRPVASAPAGGNTNPATFTDPSGDSGTAPDIANVVVSNDANGQITFRVNVAKLAVPSPVQIIVAIDSDEHAATGLSGTDYLLLADVSTNTFGLGHWNGTDFVDASAPTATASTDRAGVTFVIDRSDLGNATGLDFWVSALDGPERSPVTSMMRPTREPGATSS